MSARARAGGGAGGGGAAGKSYRALKITTFLGPAILIQDTQLRENLQRGRKAVLCSPVTSCEISNKKFEKTPLLS